MRASSVSRRILGRLGCAGVLAWVLAPAASLADEPVRIYAAGSLVAPLREAIAASGLSAQAFAPPVFGPAGLLAKRLQNGEAADLFLSANLAHPRSLLAGHRALLVMPFARNAMCLLSRQSLGDTAEAVVDRLLDPTFRLATSTPAADPGGDYAWKVFEKAEAVRPGARMSLEGKALQLMGSPTSMTPIAGKSVPATLFLADKADALIYYCSGQAETLRDVPGLLARRLPDRIDVTAVYGLALLSEKPDAVRFALFLLSDPGQAILVKHGLMPVLAGE